MDTQIALANIKCTLGKKRNITNNLKKEKKRKKE